jgi:Transglutaminase-like superfamily
MRRLRKFWASPLRFKWLLAEALVRLGVASVLRFLPPARRAQFLMRAHRVLSQPRRAAPSSEEICRAVDVAARFMPSATCLVKAHVGCAMLNRFGYAAEIRIGVLKKSSNLEAHAWVECDGLVVMGEAGNQYVELPKIVPAAGKLELPRA